VIKKRGKEINSF